MIAYRRSFRTAAVSALFLTSVSSSLAQTGWAVLDSGVWRFRAGALSRVAWNPALGDVGNMGNAGVTFSSAAPAAVQGGAAAGNAAVASAFAKWDALKAIPSVRIKLVAAAAGVGANLPVTWAANIGPPGTTANIAVNANPMPITLNTGNAAAGTSQVLRTDGWSVDKAGTRAVRINEFDVYTTTVHEVGHGIGLDHPVLASQTMQVNNVSRTAATGQFRVVEQTTPFVGQPVDLAGAALPNGARVYKDPRTNLGLFDAIGAATLYSAPLSALTSLFTAGGGAGGANRFSYNLMNNSGIDTATGLRTGYLERNAFIPVADGISVSNLIAPSGWSITRVAGGVSVDYLGTDGLLPGSSIAFSFDSNALATSTNPQVRWRIDGLGASGGDPDGEGTVAATLGFNPDNFGVLDGSYTYSFNSNLDDWQLVRMNTVLTPVPEPGALAAFAVGAAALLRRRRRR